MAVELKSVRRKGILDDSEILDLIGDETLERDLPAIIRTRMRAAARKAGREGRPFTDTDLFGLVRSDLGARDLVDELVENIELSKLRRVVERAAEVLGLREAANGASERPN